MRKITVCMMVIAWALAFALGAYAQNAPEAPSAAPPKPQAASRAPADTDERDVRELVDAIMAARVAKQLGLNDEQTVLMLRRFSEFREQLNALRKGRQEILQGLKNSLRSGEGDAQIEAKLSQLVAHDGKIAEFRKSAYEKAGAGLTVSQRAKLYVFLNEFENDMRRLIQRARERNANRWGRFAEPPRPPEPGQPPRPPRPGRLGFGRALQPQVPPPQAPAGEK